MDRMREDPTLPAALRSALREAGAETAPQKVMKQALGVIGMGTGSAWVAAHAAGKAPLASALFGGSLLIKGGVALAIFVAGSLVGGYTVHRQDQQALALASEKALAPREATVAPLRDTSFERAALPAAVRDDATMASALPPSMLPSSRVAPTYAPVASNPSKSGPVALPVPIPVIASAPEPTPALVAPAIAPATEVLRKQFASLRAIRDAVDGDQPLTALASITAHRARFPDTPFDQELLLLEARARWVQHDPTTCDVVARFTSAYSKSLMLRRVQALGVQAGCSDPPKHRSP
jgi:hypothetical protein